MRDKNMIDTASPDFVFIHLGLGSFSAINEEKVVIQGDHLGRGMPVKSRYSRIISENCYREHSMDLGNDQSGRTV
jgi:hypothetical protein